MIKELYGEELFATIENTRHTYEIEINESDILVDRLRYTVKNNNIELTAISDSDALNYRYTFNKDDYDVRHTSVFDVFVDMFHFAYNESMNEANKFVKFEDLKYDYIEYIYRKILKRDASEISNLTANQVSDLLELNAYYYEMGGISHARAKSISETINALGTVTKTMYVCELSSDLNKLVKTLVREALEDEYSDEEISDVIESLDDVKLIDLNEIIDTNLLWNISIFQSHDFARVIIDNTIIEIDVSAKLTVSDITHAHKYTALEHYNISAKLLEYLRK